MAHIFKFDLLSFLSLLIALFSLLVVIRNANRTIRFQRVQTIVDLISKLLVEINPEKHPKGWSNLIKKEYISEEHNLIEQKLILWLSLNKKYGHKIIEILKQFRTDCKQEEDLLFLKKELSEISAKYVKKEIESII